MDIHTFEMTRRSLFGFGAAGIGVLALAGCAPQSGGGGGRPELAFWDMQWGADAYDKASASLAADYAGAKVTHTAVPWDSYVAAITTAVSSGTGPDVGSGGSFLPASFYPEGAIQAVDGVVEKLKANGSYDDFVDGVFDSLTMDGHQIAIPWNIDLRCLNYRPSVLQAAGVDTLPTNWDEFLAAGRKLKSNGVGLLQLVGSATGNSTWQQILSLMLNNDGGWFDEDGNPDVVTDRNEETIEFLMQMSKDGLLNEGALALTKDDVNTLWADGKTAFALMNPTYNVTFADRPEVFKDTAVASPLEGPHGDYGTIRFVNGLMIYSAVDDLEAAEDFLVDYVDQMSVYWRDNLLTSLPSRNSISELPEFQANENATRALNEWAPIGKSQTTFNGGQLQQVASLSGSETTITFAQEVISATKDATTILTEFQAGLERVFAS